MKNIEKDLRNYSIDFAKESLKTYLKNYLKTYLNLNIDKLLEIDWFEEIDSTNLYLYNLYNLKNFNNLENIKKIRICSAWLQTHGKGTHQRSWLNQRYQGLFFSTAFYLPSLPENLSLKVGLAAVEALSEIFINNKNNKNIKNIKDVEDVENIPLFQIKWPNDIYYQGKKLGGILIQTKYYKNLNKDLNFNQGFYIVIGLGLNLQAFKNSEIQTEIKTETELNYAHLGDLCLEKNGMFFFEIMAKIIAKILEKTFFNNLNNNLEIQKIRHYLYHHNQYNQYNLLNNNFNNFNNFTEFTYQGEKIKAIDYELLDNGHLQVLIKDPKNNNKYKVIILK